MMEIAMETGTATTTGMAEVMTGVATAINAPTGVIAAVTEASMTALIGTDGAG